MGCKNIFLTGKINVGKSTAISKFLERYLIESSLIAGFKTKPFYERGALEGYYIESQIPGENTTILQSLVGINGDFGKGKYCYGIAETFEKKAVHILCESLKIPNSIILMDELGFFEKDAEKFKEQVHRTLDSDHRVLGVIKEKRNPFLDSITERKDVKVITVTLENRDIIVEEINKYWE